MGHEITHTISHFSTTITVKNKLISEGVCVNFDLSERDNIKLLKNISFNFAIKDIWENKVATANINDGIIYPLGGEIVKRLIKAHGREKFLQLLSNQSFESAIKIYGESLTALLKGIENEIKN